MWGNTGKGLRKCVLVTRPSSLETQGRQHFLIMDLGIGNLSPRCEDFRHTKASSAGFSKKGIFSITTASSEQGDPSEGLDTGTLRSTLLAVQGGFATSHPHSWQQKASSRPPL